MRRASFTATVANLLPPFFVCLVVGTIWGIYVRFHLVPLSHVASPASAHDLEQYKRFVWHTVVSQFLTAMFAICFLRSVFTHPGAPPNDSDWLRDTDHLTIHEQKSSTGQRRFCKWCQRFKLDRCHHCRVCNACVLRMDHHCPWIMNCVGFRNHKFFFLLVVYTVLDLFFIILTLSESVEQSVIEETTSHTRFILMLGLVVAVIMFVLTSGFLSFHIWLMLRGMTTIEFCEKTLPRQDCGTGLSYDLGLYQNLKSVFGPHWLLWLLPLSSPEGNGLNFRVSKPTAEKDGEPEWTGREEKTSQRCSAS